MVKLYITSEDDEYNALIASRAEIVAIEVDGEPAYYRKITDNDTIYFCYIQPSVERDSLGEQLSNGVVTMRGYYPPLGVRDDA